jgi:hypothetical protein
MIIYVEVQQTVSVVNLFSYPHENLQNDAYQTVTGPDGTFNLVFLSDGVSLQSPQVDQSSVENPYITPIGEIGPGVFDYWVDTQIALSESSSPLRDPTLSIAERRVFWHSNSTA